MFKPSAINHHFKAELTEPLLPKPKLSVSQRVENFAKNLLDELCKPLF